MSSPVFNKNEKMRKKQSESMKEVEEEEVDEGDRGEACIEPVGELRRIMIVASRGQHSSIAVLETGCRIS